MCVRLDEVGEVDEEGLAVGVCTTGVRACANSEYKLSTWISVPSWFSGAFVLASWNLVWSASPLNPKVASVLRVERQNGLQTYLWPGYLV